MASSYPKVLYAGLQASYDALATKNADILYFCTDSGKLYKGSIDFSKYCEAVATRPQTPVVARLYLIAATGTAEFYDANGWHVVSYQKVNSIDAETDPAEQSNDTIPSTKAVAEYVAAIVGGSSDVVKSITAGSTAAYIDYTTADDQSHSVEVPGVITDAAAGTTAAYIDLTNSTEADSKSIVVPGVVTDAAAGTGAAEVDLTNSTAGSSKTITVPGVITDVAAATGAGNAGKIDLTNSTSASNKSVVVPNVLKGVAAATGTGNAAKIVVSNTTESDETVTVPGVLVNITAPTATGNEAKFTFEDSDGDTVDILVPGVVTGITYEASTRTITFNKSSGAADSVELGKDIFIDPTANNRYENGNIYLYLNDGTGSTSATELVIPVTSLVTDYFGDDTDSISVSIDNTTHKVTADAVLRADVAGASGFTNALKLNTDTSAAGGVGLYVDLSDVEESIDALAEAITWGSF